MKKKLCITLFAIFIINKGLTQNKIDVGSKFLNFILEKQWEDAENLFDISVKEKVPLSSLKQIIFSLQTQVGEFKTFDNPIVLNHTSNYIGHFRNATLDIEINTNESSRIVGFFFLPISKLYKLPPYADKTKYKTEATTIVSNEFKLPGLITTPIEASNSKFPIVIFIGGSGPSDMDESLEAEKPFEDLSIGLALNGVASLRYDKRTYIYHNLPGNMTIKEEYLEDVVNVIKTAKKVPGIDSNKIFIAGHSLGGMISPLILKENPSLSGAILLEANARPLEELIYAQALYLSKINRIQTTDENLKRLYVVTQKIKNITLKDTSETYLNVKGSYWLSLNLYHPLEIAENNKHQSILVIQGGDDYQVTKTDFDLWSNTLSKNKNVSFKYYPLLNHALDEGHGTRSPTEYFYPLNTPMYLADDISIWIKRSIQVASHSL